MTISSHIIETFLRESDIEGYIEFGAPGDEYGSEAQIIAQALGEFDEKEINSEKVAVVVSEIWKESFDLSEFDMGLRQRSIGLLADQIVKTFKAPKA